MTHHAHDSVAAFVRDAIEIAEGKLAKGEIDRRAFLRALAAFGVSVGVLGEARAAAGEFVMVNFGGVAAREYARAFGPGCKKATGLNLVVDGSAASAAKIRAMVDAGNVIWDVCDYAPQIGIQLGGKYLEPIDYSIVDRKKMLDGYAFPYGTAAYVFTFVLGYNKTMLPEAPKNWVDFWDLKRFPGKRTMFKTPTGQLEAALLAAGTEPDKLYPLNLDLAISKLKEIKSEIIFWETGAQSVQLFRDREVAMGNVWSTRSGLLAKEMNGDYAFTWQDGLLMVGGWAIPKGNPAGREASNKFIASAQDPHSQAQLFVAMNSGPANPAAAELIPTNLRYMNPMEPTNLKLQVRTSVQWWGENGDKATERWLDAIS